VFVPSDPGSRASSFDLGKVSSWVSSEYFPTRLVEASLAPSSPLSERSGVRTPPLYHLFSLLPPFAAPDPCFLWKGRFTRCLVKRVCTDAANTSRWFFFPLFLWVQKFTPSESEGEALLKIPASAISVFYPSLSLPPLLLVGALFRRDFISFAFPPFH